MSGNSYTQAHNDSVHRSHESRKATNTCGYFLDLLEPSFTILDAGCGPGTVTSSLAGFVPLGHIVGVDNSESVVEKARAQTNLPTNCTFESANLLSLPFEDDHFDVVHTSQALSHIPKIVEALRELRRVCKPGGFLACREGDLPALMLNPPDHGLELWKQAMIGVMDRSNCNASCGRTLLRSFMEAGFDPSGITYTIGAVTYSGDQRQFWANTMGTRVMEDQVWRKKAVDLGLASAKDFETMRKGWETFSADEAAVFAMPCGQVVGYK